MLIRHVDSLESHKKHSVDAGHAVGTPQGYMHKHRVKVLDILLLVIQPIAFTNHVGTVAIDLMQTGHQTETSYVSGCTHMTLHNQPVV